MAESDQQPTTGQTSNVDETSLITPPSAAVPVPTTNQETTTAKDGDLLVNKPEDVQITPPPAVSAEAAPVSPTSVDNLAVTPEGSTAAIAPEKPIVVSEAEVNQTGSTNEQMSNEIEVLSGEVQALESKIDRLATNVTVPAVEAKSEKPSSDLGPITSPETKAETIPAAVEAKMADRSTTKPPTPINDIYTKEAQKQQEAEMVDSKGAPSVEPDKDDKPHPSAIGTIGEVMTIFGVIIFLLMAVSPFVKDMVGTNIWDAIKTIGWPTAGLSTLIGLILSLFSKGQGALKILAALFIILSAMMFLASTNSTLIDPVKSLFQPLFSFYL